MIFELPDLIALIVSGSGILLCLGVGIRILFFDQGVFQTRIFLGLLLVLYAIDQSNAFMAMSGIMSQHPELYFLPLVYSLSFGPLFYFFVKSRIDPLFQFKYLHLVHFILPVLQVLQYIYLGSLSVEEKGEMWREWVAPFGQHLEGGLFFILGFAYLLLSRQLLRQEKLRKHWKQPVVRWLLHFCNMLIALFAVMLVYDLIDIVLYQCFEINIFNVPWATFPLKISYASVSILIGWNALRYAHQELPLVKERAQRITSSLEARLEDLMEKEQVFLDPEIRLEGLARQLSVHKNELSAYFSAQSTNFRSYINSHRLDYFLSLLHEGRHERMTLLALAFDSGFNSKASFNRLFKEKMGKTPTEYISSESQSS